MQTRWYLRRHDGRPKLIRLVVEECGAERRGCTIAVTSRPQAREMLRILRQALQERILRADTTSATYDPAGNE